MTQEQKAIRIIKGLADELSKLELGETISFQGDWDKYTLTVYMPDGGHVHLGEMCCEDSFDRLIEDLFNHFCK